ncbi:MAG: phage portal protein, partial [Candidatus Peribacteraceae bacterium]|nr:phage portal protein [Candidatus Peribacteraceae bacterium]
MAETDIGSAIASDLASEIEDFSVDTASTDGPMEQKETYWTDPDYPQYLGYYKDEKTPEMTAVIDAKANWTIGKGFIADEETTALLDTIKGNGFDTFNTILENAVRTLLLGGNFYAEIIRDDEDNLINLKPLDPAVMRHVANSAGILIRFEQMSKNYPNKVETKFQPHEIFYLARNRIADEIHGMGIAKKLKLIIDMKNEAMADNRLINHRFAYPKFIFHLDTDDDAKIAEFKAKNDAATGEVNNMYIPKDAVVPELLAVA